MSAREKPQIFYAKDMSAQIVDELSKVVAPKDEPVCAVVQQDLTTDENAIKQKIRREIQQLMRSGQSNLSRFQQQKRSVFKAKGFRPRTGNLVCFNCNRKGQTYYNCRAKPNQRVPRQRQGQNSFNWNFNQGN